MSTFDADVCVVGAGFAGLAAGRHLMRAGRSVAVLSGRGAEGWSEEAEAADLVVLNYDILEAHLAKLGIE